ncbi:sensor histidine kinase [uncultured Kordia sp.]|uniref:sensor histidine kinase n=1 Tax=uncultured Kordia sp. TaxID=507699 RepID=UPI0026349AA2|nr:histidine kinase [uncultured Kordia sp.]
MDTHFSNTKTNLNWAKRNLDIRLLQIVAIFSLITVAVTFFRILYFQITDEKEYSLLDVFLKHFIVDWIVISFFMCMVAIMTRIFFEKNIRSVYIILFHVVVSLCIGWVFSVAHSGLLLMLGEITYEQFKFYTSFDVTISYINTTFLTYFGITSVIYTYYYSNRLKTAKLQRALLAEQLTDTRMRVLKSQLQPHFLFNTLHNISSLIETNTKQAQNMLNDLSDLLREVIVLKEDHFNTLAQELYILQKYIDIVSIRYSDHLTITTHIAPNIEDTRVPLMMIQPIVENAIKHGFTGNTEALEIAISIIEKDDHLCIEIKNNGTPISATLYELTSKGTGISNIMNRLDALYHDNYTFEVENIEHWVIVSIKIPRYHKSTVKGQL